MPDCNPLKLTELKSDFLHELYTTAEQKDHSEYDSSYKQKKAKNTTSTVHFLGSQHF